MATELTVQSERAFQKQPHIFLNSKTKAKSKKAGQGRRWYKDVGLGFRTPKTAIEGNYIGMQDHLDFCWQYQFGFWDWHRSSGLDWRQDSALQILEMDANGGYHAIRLVA
jgi:hypothetical protein